MSVIDKGSSRSLVSIFYQIEKFAVVIFERVSEYLFNLTDQIVRLLEILFPDFLQLL